MEFLMSTALCILFIIAVNRFADQEKRLAGKPMAHFFLLGVLAAVILVVSTVAHSNWDKDILTGVLGLNNENIMFALIDDSC